MRVDHHVTKERSRSATGKEKACFNNDKLQDEDRLQERYSNDWFLEARRLAGSGRLDRAATSDVMNQHSHREGTDHREQTGRTGGDPRHKGPECKRPVRPVHTQPR